MSSNCGVCGHLCSEAESVKCAGNCGKVVHSKCIKDDLEGKKTRSQREWRCKECRYTSSSHSSAGSATSPAITKDFLVRVLEDLKAEVFLELKTFRNEFVELSNSVKFVSDKLDESSNLMKQMREEFSSLKKQNEDLRALNTDLTGKMNMLEDKVRAMEQYSRKDNIEISGLPVSPNEDVISLVKDIGAAVGFKINEGDISAAHRVPSFQRNRTPSLVVKFARRMTRDSILGKYRERKGGLTARNVNAVFPQDRVFINEHLTPENKVFLSKLKAKCKEAGYAYAWTRDGKFFVRKSQGDRYIIIKGYDSLDNIK